ncbi:uncharacterized protein LOC120326893 [Styela clava]
MDLLFNTQATTTTVAPVQYGSILNNGLSVPYDNAYGIASVVARDMSLALFVMLASFTGRPSYPKALLHCDFEEGWCPGFVPTNTSDIPWNLWKGNTPSNGTGPNADHTRFNEYGTYAYVEASGSRSGETAVFTTPPVMMMAEPHYCLRYWYNMYGSGSGAIWIYWNAAGEAQLRKVVDKLAGQLSKDGNEWKESTTTLRSTTIQKHYRPVVFEFRGIRGTSYKSDIAIDDILLLPGKCEARKLSRTATTMTMRGIMTTPAPLTTTTESWKASDPDYIKCGDDYANIKKQLCCNNVKRPRLNRGTRCCGERTYHNIMEVCCGGVGRSINDYGCCRGRISYKKREKGCCNNYSTFDLMEEECVNQEIRKRRDPLTATPRRRNRGKRSVMSRWGFPPRIFE